MPCSQPSSIWACESISSSTRVLIGTSGAHFLCFTFVLLTNVYVMNSVGLNNQPKLKKVSQEQTCMRLLLIKAEKEGEH